MDPELEKWIVNFVKAMETQLANQIERDLMKVSGEIKDEKERR